MKLVIKLKNKWVNLKLKFKLRNTITLYELMEEHKQRAIDNNDWMYFFDVLDYQLWAFKRLFGWNGGRSDTNTKDTTKTKNNK